MQYEYQVLALLHLKGKRRHMSKYLLYYIFYLGEKKEVLPPAAKAVAKSQRMLEYPVSSGNAHRYFETILLVLYPLTRTDAASE